MRLRCIAILLYSLAIVGLAGCNARDSTYPDSMNVVDFSAVIDNFTFQTSVLIEANETQVKAPPDSRSKPLLHTDPLKLPESKFIISGSDTLSPATQSMIDRFHDEGFRGVFRMNHSSTGVGIKAMCRGETMHLVNASRRLKTKEEKLCKENGIVPVQIQIGYDPFVLITNEKNFWMTSIRKDQLPRLFESERWSDLNPSYPYNKISFFVPRKEGGAMSAMSELVYGNKDAPQIRDVKNGQFYPYNLELTRDLENDTYGVGFASYGKLTKLKRLTARIIPVSGARPIVSGSSYPIKRSLYIITSTNALEIAEVQTFVAHYLNSAYDVLPLHGFAPLDGAAATLVQNDLLTTLESSGVVDIHVSEGPAEP